MSLIEFIQDYRWWVLAISLPLIVIYGRVLVLASFGVGAPPTKPMTAPLRRIPPKPGSASGVAKPSSMPTPPPEGRQEVLPSSLDAGLSGHQKAGSAKTVKLPAAPSKPTDSPSPIVGRKSSTDLPTSKELADSDAEALDGLFGKRDEAIPPSESPSVALRRKASRMEELGFHHGIVTDKLPDGKAAVPSATPVPAANSPQIMPDGTPRSSTAELTSILERIDKFLAEDTPAKPVPTLPPNIATTTLVKSVSEEEAHAAQRAPTEPMPPTDSSGAVHAATHSATKGTEAMAKPETTAIAKPDAQKKTQPMWARPDAMDEDVEAKAKDEKKPDTGDQQRLF